MGVQLTIKAETMKAAGWTSTDVVEAEAYWDEYAQIMFPAMVDRCWDHPERGRIWAYAVSSGDFYIDCNVWGRNRQRCIDLGLFDLEHYLG